MNNLLTPDQYKIVNQISSRFNIPAEEIRFFSDEKDPFISYEGCCVLINHLCPEISGIDLIPVEAFSSNSLAMKCSLIFTDGRIRSAVGIVNFDEMIDGTLMSNQQLNQTASGRALRNALRTAGIDLIKLLNNDTKIDDAHPEQSKSKYHISFCSTEPGEDSLRQSLLAQAHVLGSKVGLISKTSGKVGWQSYLTALYGVDSCEHLSNEQLSDLIAHLRAVEV